MRFSDMKSRLSSLLKKEFHKRMTVGFPDFPKSGVAFGGIIYRKRNEAVGRNAFVLLEPDTKYDRFTLELAVSANPDFPFDILPGDKSPDGAVRNRIRSFLGDKSDGWWRTNESDQLMDLASFMNLQSKEKVDEAAARIPQLVEDAFGHLQVALPKFLATIR